MERDYAALHSQPMREGTIVRQPAGEAPRRVTLEDPALEVMTDLTRVPAVLVDPYVEIEAAMRIMLRRNVRSLFGVNVDNEIVGLITATDLLGEKPLQHIERHGGRRSDIRVADIMTPASRLEVLHLRDVESARVGHVVATLKRAGRQHAMVVEDEAGGRQVVRGVFSTSQLERQLGQPVPTSAIAHTFADIEAALSGR
jgi:CBS-domain-containing membrane protein